MEKRQRTRLASVAVLALVFVTGGLLGVALDRSATSRQVAAETPREREAPRDEDQPEERNRSPRMYEHVGLSVELLRVADSLVREHQVARRQLHDEFRRDADSIVAASGREDVYQEEADALLQELRGKIRALMTDEQAAKYSTLLEQEAERRRSERERSADRGN